MIKDMPKRQHYLKFQCSIPRGGRNMAAARQKVIDAAATHLRAVAGITATNVEVRAVYQERGGPEDVAQWWDVLVVCGFDGPLTDHAKNLKIERNSFEFEKLKKDSGVSGLTEKKVLLS